MSSSVIQFIRPTSGMIRFRTHHKRQFEHLRCFICLLILYSIHCVFPFQASSSSSTHLRAAPLRIGGDNNNMLRRTNQEYYVFWLMPAEPDRTDLQATIDKLAKTHDSVVFAPHVTLAPPTQVELVRDPDEALKQLASSIPPEDDTSIRLTTTKAGYGFKYTQSVFLELQNTPSLLRLYSESRRVSHLLNLPPNPEEDHFPHLSLLYENCCEETREQVAASVSPPDEIAFDSIRLMRIQLPVDNADDVRKWQVVGNFPLTHR